MLEFYRYLDRERTRIELFASDVKWVYRFEDLTVEEARKIDNGMLIPHLRLLVVYR